MPPRNRGTPTPKKRAEMDWAVTDDPDCVAEDGWEEEPDPWTCTTCKKYVKMKHILKMWPSLTEDAKGKMGERREGKAEFCNSRHFRLRYHEITVAAGVRNSRPGIMLYSNMAMVWAEIVLHKVIDWRTVAGLNVSQMNRSAEIIPTDWEGPSDCIPHISNRGAPQVGNLAAPTFANPTNVGGNQYGDRHGRNQYADYHDQAPDRGAYNRYDDHYAHSYDNIPERVYGYGREYHHNRHRNTGYEQDYRIDDAPVTFGGAGPSTCYRHGGGYYGTGANSPDLYVDPWAPPTIEANSDPWDEVPDSIPWQPRRLVRFQTPPRNDERGHHSTTLPNQGSGDDITPPSRQGREDTRSPTPSRLGRRDLSLTPPRPGSGGSPTPPRRGYPDRGTPPSGRGCGDYSTSPRNWGYPDSSPRRPSRVNRDLSYETNDIPPPTFGTHHYIMDDRIRIEQEELEMAREAYITRLERHSFYLSRENERLRSLTPSPNYLRGHSTRGFAERAGPAQVNRDDEWVGPEYYERGGGSQEHHGGIGGSTYFSNQRGRGR